MVTVEISLPRSQARRAEVESLVGANRLYRKGTDESQYLDYRERAEADLAVVSLNLVPEVKARILGG